MAAQPNQNRIYQLKKKQTTSSSFDTDNWCHKDVTSAKHILNKNIKYFFYNRFPINNRELLVQNCHLDQPGDTKKVQFNSKIVWDIIIIIINCCLPNTLRCIRAIRNTSDKLHQRPTKIRNIKKEYKKDQVFFFSSYSFKSTKRSIVQIWRHFRTPLLFNNNN